MEMTQDETSQDMQREIQGDGSDGAGGGHTGYNFPWCDMRNDRDFESWETEDEEGESDPEAGELDESPQGAETEDAGRPSTRRRSRRRPRSRARRSRSNLPSCSRSRSWERDHRRDGGGGPPGAAASAAVSCSSNEWELSPGPDTSQSSETLSPELTLSPAPTPSPYLSPSFSPPRSPSPYSYNFCVGPSALAPPGYGGQRRAMEKQKNGEVGLPELWGLSPKTPEAESDMNTPEEEEKNAKKIPVTLEGESKKRKKKRSHSKDRDKKKKKSKSSHKKDLESSGLESVTCNDDLKGKHKSKKSKKSKKKKKEKKRKHHEKKSKKNKYEKTYEKEEEKISNKISDDKFPESPWLNNSSENEQKEKSNGLKAPEINSVQEDNKLLNHAPLPVEGEAMAELVKAEKETPQKEEIGLTSEQISECQ